MRTLILMALVAVACDSNNNNGAQDLATAQTMNDLSSASNPDLAPSCSMNPMTHVELLNACTNADSVDKTPFYPMLAPNGQLPPLP